MAKELDKKTLDLIDEIKRRKKEIKSIDRTAWKTNCSFTSNSNIFKSVNIQVVGDISTLIQIYAELLREKHFYEQAIKDLSLQDSFSEFSLCGFSFADWSEDIKTRINKIQVVVKKKKLEELESRLNMIISPELKAQMELDAITEELGS